MYKKACLRSLFSLQRAMFSPDLQDVDSRMPFCGRRGSDFSEQALGMATGTQAIGGSPQLQVCACQLWDSALSTTAGSVCFLPQAPPAQPGLLNEVQQQRWAAQSLLPLWHRAPRPLLASCCWQAEGTGQLAHCEGLYTKCHCMALGCGRQMKGISKSMVSYFYLRKG